MLIFLHTLFNSFIVLLATWALEGATFWARFEVDQTEPDDSLPEHVEALSSQPDLRFRVQKPFRLKAGGRSPIPPAWDFVCKLGCVQMWIVKKRHIFCLGHEKDRAQTKLIKRQWRTLTKLSSFEISLFPTNPSMVFAPKSLYHTRICIGKAMFLAFTRRALEPLRQRAKNWLTNVEAQPWLQKHDATVFVRAKKITKLLLPYAVAYRLFTFLVIITLLFHLIYILPRINPLLSQFFLNYRHIIKYVLYIKQTTPQQDLTFFNFGLTPFIYAGDPFTICL